MRNYKDDVVWKMVEDKLSAIIDNAYKKLGQDSTTYKEVLGLRGRIAVAKELLDLPGLNETLATTRGQNAKQ